MDDQRRLGTGPPQPEEERSVRFDLGNDNKVQNKEDETRSSDTNKRRPLQRLASAPLTREHAEATHFSSEVDWDEASSLAEVDKSRARTSLDGVKHIMSPYSSDMVANYPQHGDASWLRNRKGLKLEADGKYNVPMAGDLASPRKSSRSVNDILSKHGHGPLDSQSDDLSPRSHESLVGEYASRMLAMFGGNGSKSSKLLRPSQRAQATGNIHQHPGEAAVIEPLREPAKDVNDVVWHESDGDDPSSSDDDDAAAEFLSLTSGDNILWASDDEEEESRIVKEKRKNRLKKKWIYIWALITFVQLLLIAAGFAHIFAGNGLKSGVQVWRLCFFFALLPYCWVLGTFLTWTLIKLIEKIFLTYPSALYYTYALRKQVKWLLRSLSVLVLWACMMLIEDGDQSQGVNTTYEVILRVLGCLSLFLTGNLLKRLFAKLMTSSFTGSNQKARMETALKQEKLLSTLMKPRPKSEDAMPLMEKSFFGFKNDKKSLDGMRREYASDTTGIHPKFRGLNIDRKAYSMDILHEDRPHVDEGLNVVDRDHSGQIQIQIDSTEPSGEDATGQGESGEMDGSPKNPLSLKDFVPMQPVAKGAQAVGDAFVRLGSFTKKTFADEDGEQEDETVNKKKKIDPVTKAKQLERLNRLERYMRKEQIQLTFRDTLNQVENATIDHRSVKKLATFLFWNIKHDIEAREISRDDVDVFFEKEEDTDRAFAMLDSDGDGSICMKDCISAVEKIYSERCNLASTLRDTKAITKVLEFLIGLVIHTIFIFFYLMILGANVSQIWVGFTGLLVSFSFIFATTVSNVFQNIIFLFGVHAYDIGDTLLINNQYLTVDEITINYTCCVSGYNLKVWFPNTVLQSNLFVNLTTSGTKWEVIYVYVDIDTDPSILDKIEQACTEVRQEKKGEYGPGFRVKFGSAAMPYKVGIEMVYEYSHQGINFHRTACARSWMYETFCRVLTENDIQFTWPETKRSTDLDFSGWGPGNVVQGQPGQPDSSRGGRSNLQSDIFQQQS